MKDFLRGLGNLIISVTAIISTILDIQIVWYEWGYRGVVLSVLAYPLAILSIPIFALIKYGRWLPILVTYGGGIIGLVLLNSGGASDEE